MAGLDPAIHGLPQHRFVDARNKSGHDEIKWAELSLHRWVSGSTRRGGFADLN
jgi:hypothetical protein